MAVIFAAQWTYANTPGIEVVGLFKDGAILIIDGQQRMLRKGLPTEKGVEVIEADAKSVTLVVDGEIKKMSLSKKISTQFAESDEKPAAHISRGAGGHYWAPGRVNNRACEFVVDTGATYVSLNSHHAAQLGVSYKDGIPVVMRTANGVKRSFKVTLDSVTVGMVTVRGVDAVVSEGRFPEVILLGNAFLNRVEMRVEAGVMVLQSKI
ncbi:MAG: TIGR02281 family clan AA aspartic protease [Cellvibrionaceae bacterium]|nr:TIGR02281 family clan AA aspartic protease [Cellvibrionaceae bacterium]